MEIRENKEGKVGKIMGGKLDEVRKNEGREIK